MTAGSTQIPASAVGAEVMTPRLRRGPLPYVVLGLLVLIALAVRWLFVDVQSGDYRSFLDPWFQHLAANGFAGLAEEFSNYNTPYLVLLWLATKLPVSQIVAVKLVSVVFDGLLAYFAYRIVRVLRPASAWWPVVITGAVLLLPTVVLNSSAWGQCDAIYASLCLGSVYFLLRRQAWVACALFGLAFAFKLQAIFLLPVLVAVLIVNRMRVRALVMVPLAFLAALVPAWIAGRGLLSQLAVYPAQITGSSGGGALGDPARSGAGRRPEGGVGRGGAGVPRTVVGRAVAPAPVGEDRPVPRATGASWGWGAAPGPPTPSTCSPTTPRPGTRGCPPTRARRSRRSVSRSRGSWSPPSGSGCCGAAGRWWAVT